MQLGNPHRKTGMRFSIAGVSVFVVLIGMFSALASLAIVGQNVQADQKTSDTIARSKNKQLQEVDRDAEVNEAKKQAGIADPTDRLILGDYNPNNFNDKDFFEAMRRRAFIPTYTKNGYLQLLDRNKNIIGDYRVDKGKAMICDRNEACQDWVVKK